MFHKKKLINTHTHEKKSTHHIILESCLLSFSLSTKLLDLSHLWGNNNTVIVARVCGIPNYIYHTVKYILWI